MCAFRTIVESSTFRFLSDEPYLGEDAMPRFPSGRPTRCAHLSRRLEIIKRYLWIFYAIASSLRTRQRLWGR